MLPLLGAAAALLVVALFFGEGSSDARLFWIGAGAALAVLVAVSATFAAVLPRPAPTPLGWAALGAATAFVLWNATTIAWSIAPDRSWTYANRGVAYLALAGLGLYVGSLVPRPTVATGAAFACLLGAAAGWALLGKVFPGLFPDGARVARLRSPVGYWNALALLMALGLPLALWVAARRARPRALRAAGTLLLYGASVALVLTYSRAGIVVAGIGVAGWLLLADDRLEGLLVLASGVVPAAAVAGWASTQPGLVDDLQTAAARERAGGFFALALALGAMGALGLAHLAARWSGGLAARERAAWSRRLAVGVTVAAVAAVVAASAAAGGPGRWLDDFRGSGEVVQGSGRLGELSSNNRWAWWKEAWRIAGDHTAGGTGARTFEIARRPLRVGSVVTNEPHNVVLQFLAETGVVGVLLGGAAAVLALLAVREAVRRLRGDERAAAVALGLWLPLYLLHALVDIDFDFVAATGPVFLVVGVLLGSGRRPLPGRSRPLAAIGTGLAGLLVLYSLTAPWYSQRRVEDAYRAIGRGDARAAAAAARQARELDPLSAEPLWAWALAAASAGDDALALRRFREAADLQPENSETWYALGAFEFDRGRYLSAYRHLDRAYGLDPYGPAGLPGGLLDQARAKVSGG